MAAIELPRDWRTDCKIHDGLWYVPDACTRAAHDELVRAIHEDEPAAIVTPEVPVRSLAPADAVPATVTPEVPVRSLAPADGGAAARAVRSLAPADDDTAAGAAARADASSCDNDRAVQSSSRADDAAEWTELSSRRLRAFGGAPADDGAVCDPLPEWFRSVADAVAPPLGGAPDFVLVNSYDADGGISPHSDGPRFADAVAVLSLEGSALVRFGTAPRPARVDRRRGPTRGVPEAQRVACTRAEAARSPPRLEPRRVAAGLVDKLASPSLPPRVELLLRPRSLLVFSGDFYSLYVHLIAARPADEISSLCANRKAAHVQVGDVVPRALRRTSLTLRRFARVALPADALRTRAAAKRRREQGQWWRRHIGEFD